MSTRLYWYEISQNNSGGSFDVDDKLCHRLFIQAPSEARALGIAEELGVYWNGCETGRDCSCCGDRWSEYMEKITFPVTDYEPDGPFKTIEEYAQHLADKYGWTQPDARLFFADGMVKEIFKVVVVADGGSI